MEERFCQSCGMPLGADDSLCGADADGKTNTDYCKYCYENGKFTSDVDLEGMIEECVPHMVASGMPEAQAREMMRQFLPHLKRWKRD